MSWLSDTRWVTVAKVYDGDTFQTRQGEKIRFLNLNTPEIQHRDSQAEIGGNIAKKALTALLLGKQVRLRFDKEKKDRYGRTLAQVWMRDGRWVNAWLLNQGYAHLYNFEPNTRWAKKLAVEESKARQKKLGIWKTARFRVIQATKVSHKNIGQYRVMEGVIKAVFGRQHWSFLMGKVRVSIPKAYRQYFRYAPDVNQGLRVMVRGRIRISRKGQLFLSLHSPYDLEVLR
ncbi:MAG: thermonuclease family protein [Mariprofundaceae bacterium]|nr:thermonuclease family protein [Mariprofundaceae bacterium]